MGGHHGHEGSHRIAAAGAGIALIGCPNAGKSSVFNHLTGMRARTANYPGVTVTWSQGRVGRGADADLDADTGVNMADLPGTYGLTPVSPDEQIVADHLAGRLEGMDAPDALLVVVDATTLRRSLSLVGQTLATGKPCAVALTMMDELRARGGQLDVAALSRALGVPVHEVVGHRGRGITALRESVLAWPTWPVAVVAPPVEDSAELDGWIASVAERAGYRPAEASTVTRGIDRVLLHPLWGVLAFLAVMFLFFQTIFTAATPLMNLIEALFGRLADAAAAHIGNPTLADFVGTALIGGVGGVLVFLPQIVLLFLMISLLEGVGYLSRAAFLMDRVMALSGLDGRAFVAMLSSVACAIPGIMSTRTMPSSRDRLATMLSAPLMTCSARLPVYLLLVSLLVPHHARWGPLGLQGLVLFLLYLAGGVSTLIAASLLKSTFLRHGGLPFYLELPPYRVPSVRTVALSIWSAASTFLRKVATIILVASAVLWALMSFPTRHAETLGMAPDRASAYVLDHSYAASAGRAIEPAFAPLGFEWRINVGLVGAMAAREVFVATLGQVVAAENAEDPQESLRALTYTDGPRAGERVFTPPTIVALLTFFVYAMQCISTLAVMRRESNSWRWPALAFAYMSALAWIMAYLARLVTIAIT
ncbi:MAG: ferrous iron transporter B [Kineosporiaceae bacterium]